MRHIPVALLAFGAALLAAHHAAASDPSAVPVLAVFSFAVSAFREPLR